MTFTLGTRAVYTRAETDFSKGSCRKEMKNGAEVEVRGYMMSDDRVRADRVIFYDDDD